jgi:hypothetical protein
MLTSCGESPEGRECFASLHSNTRTLDGTFSFHNAKRISKIDFSLYPHWFGVQIVKMERIQPTDRTPRISQI